MEGAYAKPRRLTQYVWHAASFAILLDCEISGEEGGWHVLDALGMSLLLVISFSSSSLSAKQCVHGCKVLPTEAATE